MKKLKSQTHLPSASSGELKLENAQLDVTQKYWILLTAKNEKLKSRVAKVDFQPLDPAGFILKLNIIFIRLIHQNLLFNFNV